MCLIIITVATCCGHSKVEVERAFAILHCKLGKELSLKGMHHEALVEYQKAAARDPASPRAVAGLAQARASAASAKRCDVTRTTVSHNV